MAFHHQDRKDLHRFPSELLSRHTNHHSAIKRNRRHSPFWQKLFAGSSSVAAVTLLLLLLLPDQTHGRQTPTHSSLSEPPPLTFSPRGLTNTFQISIFEDLHFGENAWEKWGPLQDASSIRVMNSVLDSEPSTNLVVLNGDLITGENTFKENSTTYIDQIVEPMVRRGLTWASTYGNHDSAFNLSREALFEEEKKWLSSRTGRMVTTNEEAGVTNYYLPVYPARCENINPKVVRRRARQPWYRWAFWNLVHINHFYPNQNQNQNQQTASGGECDTPALILWFFDSRGGNKYQQRHPKTGQLLSEPNWVHQSVVDWFISTSASMAAKAGGGGADGKGRIIPSIGFVHIPTNASLALQQGQQGQQQGGVDAHRQPGINDDQPLSQQGQGWCANGEDGEGCGYGEQDVPFMEAIASIPGMMALFSGHDHGNTWCYKWDGKVPGVQQKAVVAGEDDEGEGEGNGHGYGRGRGIDLCFGQHTGYGGYGSWIRGSRQIVVDQEGLKEFAIRTHIRLENGEIVGAVTLNATYGQDRYPATPNDKTHLADPALQEFR
ncbi:Metallo-dependent phosphatase-like protein [Neurospora hispaniola]|uniref:Metallo-dependent phosphatase-like protein n=1 Tax=Neurospora hispaniola TaxID=588809 RepID=A0AAJ0MM29_9PEZI|nr:Metallo-dependent phosphatase-like protein [Neurospora hispaniola]